MSAMANCKIKIKEQEKQLGTKYATETDALLRPGIMVTSYLQKTISKRDKLFTFRTNRTSIKTDIIRHKKPWFMFKKNFKKYGKKNLKFFKI